MRYVHQITWRLAHLVSRQSEASHVIVILKLLRLAHNSYGHG